MAPISSTRRGKVAINSKETIEALKYLKDLYPTFVPGTLSWGDPSNNRAYAANECWLTANGVSLYYALKNDAATRAIADDTEHAPLPYGVVGKPPQASLILNGMVFKHTKFPNAAKAYILFMMEAEQYDPVAHRLPRLLVAYAQGLQQQRGVEVRSRSWRCSRAPPRTSSGRATRARSRHAAGAVAAEYIMVQMCASVASGQATPEEAAKEAERRSQALLPRMIGCAAGSPCLPGRTL